MHKSDSDWIVIPFVAGLGQIPVAGPQEKKNPQLRGGQPSHADPAPFAQRLATSAPQDQSADLAGLNCW